MYVFYNLCFFYVSTTCVRGLFFFFFFFEWLFYGIIFFPFNMLTNMTVIFVVCVFLCLSSFSLVSHLLHGKRVAICM